MDKAKYFGLYDFEGWKAAKADGEVERHLQCGYYAAWVNPDGGIHAVNWHEAFNSDKAAKTYPYQTNYANGMVRWYGTPGGEYGFTAEKPLTQQQADVLIKLLFNLDPNISYLCGQNANPELHRDKMDTVSHIRRMQHTV